METLSYGFKKPSRPDKGVQYFPALEENIQRVNDHTHNGVNTAKLVSGESVTAVTMTLDAADWEDLGSGKHRQLVDCPANVTMGQVNMQFYLVGGADDGALVHPTVERVTDTSFHVFLNDPGVGLKVVFAT